MVANNGCSILPRRKTNGMGLIVSAANCITIPAKEFISLQLFQAHCSTLARLLNGEVCGSSFEELKEHIVESFITPIPNKLSSACDAFLWSPIVDERCSPIDYYGWDWSPNISYSKCLKSNQEVFFTKYPLKERPSLNDRESCYVSVHDSLSKANPNGIKILLLYEASRLALSSTEDYESYIKASKHMSNILGKLGWFIYNFPIGHYNKDDNNWAHYDPSYTKSWIKDILLEHSLI